MPYCDLLILLWSSDVEIMFLTLAFIVTFCYQVPQPLMCRSASLICPLCRRP